MQRINIPIILVFVYVAVFIYIRSALKYRIIAFLQVSNSSQIKMVFPSTKWKSGIFHQNEVYLKRVTRKSRHIYDVGVTYIKQIFPHIIKKLSRYIYNLSIQCHRLRHSPLVHILLPPSAAEPLQILKNT